MQSEIVQSIDLGYSFVKYVHNANKECRIKSFEKVEKEKILVIQILLEPAIGE